MRSMTFVVDDLVDTQITITEVAGGQLRFDLKLLGGGIIGDLRALYLDLAGTVAAGSLAATAIDPATGLPLPQGASLITGVVSGEATVSTLGGDTNMNGQIIKELGRFDFGIAFGTKAVAGDDLREASFLLSGPGLTLDMMAHQDLGLRITSVGPEGGSRTAALRIGDATGGVAKLDALEVGENASLGSAGNLLANDGTAGVNTVAAARWGDGSAFTQLPTGGLTSALTSGGKTFGTITVASDGTVALDANGPDANSLALGETRSFTFTYTSRAADGSTATATATITLTGTNDAPEVDGPVRGTAFEDGAVVVLNALARAQDPDVGSILRVVDVPAGMELPDSVSFDAATQSFRLNPMAYQWLAAGETTTVTVNYGVSDGIVTTPAQVMWTITGTNDAPKVSGAVTGTVVEDGAVVVLDALAQAYDEDRADQLRVVDLAPAREFPDGVSFDAGTQTFRFDPTAFQWQGLAAGETRLVTLNYGVSDGTVSAPASVSWIITGVNDAPEVDGPVRGTAVEDGAIVVLDALAQAYDPDHSNTLRVVGVPPGMELPDGVSYNASTQAFRLNPAAYQLLAEGETATVVVSYGVSDGKVTTPASVSWTITGTNDAPEVNGVVTGVVLEDGAVVMLDALTQAYDEDRADQLRVANLPPARELPDGVSFDPTTQSFRFDPTVFQWQSLGAGEVRVVTVNYGVSDGTATTPASVSWTITGVNDTPEVDGPVLGTAVEDGAAVVLHALAQVYDADGNDTLRVVNVPPKMALPEGVSYDTTTRSFRLDPSAFQWQELAAGQTTVVTVNYGISDGIVITPASVSWTVTGTNDAPVVYGPVKGAAIEDGAIVVLDALARAYDEDRADQLRVVSLPPTRELPDGVSFDPTIQTFRFDPTVFQWQSLGAGEVRVVTVNYGVSDGTATTPASVSWTITGVNDAPEVDGPVRGTAVEDGAIVTLNALAEAWDPDYSNTLQVVNVPPKMGLPEGVSYDAATRSFHFDPSAYQWQELGAGETTVVMVNYGVSDGTLITPASVSWTVTGRNDAPVVVRPVTGTAVEDGAVAVLDALAWAYDDDRNDQLRVVNLPPAQELPGGVSFDAATQSFRLDPTAFQWQGLGAGETATATVRYGISDGRVTTTALVSWTITGRNDAPVVDGPVTGTATEDGKLVVLNALAQASDPDQGNALSVVNVPPKMGLPEGVSFNSATQSFHFDPSGLQWQDLAAGQTTVVTVNYGVSDGTAITPAWVSWTVTGRNDAPVARAGTFYEVAEGNSLQLRGSAYDPDAGDSFVFAWDLNRDRVVDATGDSPIISAEMLRNLGLPLDTDLTIELIVTDSLGAEHRDAARLVIRSTADDFMA